MFRSAISRTVITAALVGALGVGAMASPVEAAQSPAPGECVPVDGGGQWCQMCVWLRGGIPICMDILIRT